MEDPAKEIDTVVRLVTGAMDPESQNAAALKYYAPDVTFRHPLSVVASAPDSRAELLAILDYYRIISPVIVHIVHVAYAADTLTAYVDATQTFHIRWSPFKPAPARFFIRFKLRPVPTPGEGTGTVYLIAEHEDFYHPDELMALFVPPLAPLIRWGLRVGAWACGLNARVLEALGF
ncbi:hypothetical protein L226DRAFT_539301 [Lentinus tigrinus ALCF2SS1-7]|uniref:SigF-like NTF2-like domain-containing protein n=1 Tax=Lentinus tigrinus ALCF2SS1-6 TaxID=1328759 RepID=A0A5C2RSG6_9APHY|nr:hypothetical protein L227DRAFT_344886 [Lentinus tigrinus ALCF2SS1-6]RPD70053.1 hypothetical protein L226DRAFT_539301 [Lentinus tigrinus ALCF2SS1-7]